jgi:hypothetical protein
VVTVRVEGYMTPDGGIKFENVSRRGKTLGEILDSGLVGQGAEAWADEPDSIEWLEQQRLYTRNLKHFTPIIGDLARKPY